MTYLRTALLLLGSGLAALYVVSVVADAVIRGAGAR